MKTAKSLLPIISAVVLLLIIFRIWVPNFLNPENLLDLAQQVSINAILAFGITLVILTGGIDLSIGALVALVGTSTVFLLLAFDFVGGGFLAIVGGLLVASAFGLGNGVCAARTKMPPFIITLATMLIARGAALRFNQGRPMHIPDEHHIFLSLGNARLFGIIPVPVLVMLILFFLCVILLHRTRFGQYLYAIGGNREAARFTGIPIVRIETIVYVICGVLAGIAGMIHASQLYSAEPASGVMFELQAIAAAVVGGTSFTGGRGTMYGTLIGAIIIGILDKGLNQAGVHFSYQYIVKGAVILVAVYMDVRRKS